MVGVLRRPLRLVVGRHEPLLWRGVVGSAEARGEVPPNVVPIVLQGCHFIKMLIMTEVAIYKCF